MALAALLAAGCVSPAPERVTPAGRATLATGGSAATADAPSGAASRAALARATAEARAVLAKRAALPDASAETRRTARGLDLLAAALHTPSASLDDELARAFRTGPSREIFVTGYHEPTLAARRKPDPTFRYPLYRQPAVNGGPLPTRAEIEDGALAGRGLELFWTDDPVELFFLQVQGSGRLRLEDGSIVRVGYAGNNGRTYRAIGSVLVERGVYRRDEVTAPVIKAWLRANPSQAPDLMRTNPRYVFFSARPGSGDDGPPGALGVPLVPWRSVAVDPKIVPLGSIGRLVVPLPDGGTFDALVIAMDTGTAITGPGRLDLFCGADERAERVAGELRHPGTISWLQPLS